MPEFLDVLASYNVREAHLQNVWQREGHNLTQSRSRRLDNPHYARRIVETARFLANVYNGTLPRTALVEAMSTSDFPLLFGDVLDRQTLAAYREWPQTYRSIARIETVSDFRAVERREGLTGGDALLEEVKELEEYPAASLDETSPLTYRVKKHGRRLPFSWEMIVNDPTNEMRDIPNRFGRASRRSEQRFATELYVSASGPRGSVYSNANGNIVNTNNGADTDNPPLSAEGLQDGFTVLAQQTDTTGEPIMVEAVVLEIPPALTVVAQNLLNSTQLIIGADTDAQRIVTTNWMRGQVTLVVNPLLSTLNPTNGTTSWYLHAASTTGRPFIALGFLRGYEDPQIFIKSPNAMRVGGGGLIDPLQGDFDNDSIDYKIRHVFGGMVLEPRASVASNGTGT